MVILFKMIDALIVGGGLAGCVISHKLLSEGKSIYVIDKSSLSSSSKVAAGIYNPIAGKYFSLSWSAEEVWSDLELFYQRLEKKLGQNFLFPLPINRILSNEDQNLKWNKRKIQSRYKPFLAAENAVLPNYINTNKFGHISIKQSGYLSVENFITHSLSYFHSKASFLDDFFDFNSLIINPKSIEYKGLKARRIIICTGYLAAKSDLFSFLPFTPMKGEILLIKNDIQLKQIFTKACFILPQHGGKIKVGSTYNWQEINEDITEYAKDYLLAKVKDLLNHEPSLEDQFAGIRPSVKDRRPLIGQHPKYSNVLLFNGLGSKGVSLAPYLADCLLKLIFDNKRLPQDIDLQRYA